MATVRFTPFGIVVDFSHSEITQITNHLNTGAATAATVCSLLGNLGVTGQAAGVAMTLGGILWLGGSLLAGCNSNQRGIRLTILWVGPTWCHSL